MQVHKYGGHDRRKCTKQERMIEIKQRDVKPLLRFDNLSVICLEASVCRNGTPRTVV